MITDNTAVIDTLATMPIYPMNINYYSQVTVLNLPSDRAVVSGGQAVTIVSVSVTIVDVENKSQLVIPLVGDENVVVGVAIFPKN